MWPVAGRLLANGAEVKITDKNDNTPWYLAALKGHKDVHTLSHFFGLAASGMASTPKRALIISIWVSGVISGTRVPVSDL